jgi:fermentation-respiration switch protein FrsA (DUF1100 family)
MTVLGRIVGLVAAAYVALCVVVVLARNRVVFPIRGGPAGDPQRFGLTKGESVAIPTADGAQLAGWFLPPAETTPAPWPVLLWFHGNGETVAGLASVLRAFQPAHAALLALDYRGYGASTGRPTVANALRDADAALAWLRTRPDVDAGRVVVYGRSVGSGPAVHLAATRQVAGLVLESAFTSLPGMTRMHFPFFPSFLAGSGFDNLDAIARVTCPVLFVHGDRDRTIPIEMGRALAARAPRVEEFLVIPGADHNDTYDLGGAAYASRVRQFVEHVTGEKR